MKRYWGAGWVNKQGEEIESSEETLFSFTLWYFRVHPCLGPESFKASSSLGYF
jgi:hypothetical protein